MRYRIAAGLVCLLLALCIPLVSAAPVSDILYPAVPAGTVNATLASADLNGNPGNAGFVTGLALRAGLNANAVFAQSGSAAIVFQAQGNTSLPVTALETATLDSTAIAAHSGLFVWTSGSNAGLSTEPALLPAHVVVVRSEKVVSYDGPPGTGITVGAVTTVSENPGVQVLFPRECQRDFYGHHHTREGYCLRHQCSPGGCFSIGQCNLFRTRYFCCYSGPVSADEQ